MIGEVWFGVLAPAGTPVTVTDKLRDGLAKSIAQIPTAQLQDAGLSPVASDGKTLGTLIANETKRWAQLIREANIKFE